MEIKKVLFNRKLKQKYVIIPKNSDIKVGDYVLINIIENGGSYGEAIKKD